MKSEELESHWKLPRLSQLQMVLSGSDCVTSSQGMIVQAVASPFCQTYELKEEVMEMETLLLIPDKRSSTTEHRIVH